MGILWSVAAWTWPWPWPWPPTPFSLGLTPPFAGLEYGEEKEEEEEEAGEEGEGGAEFCRWIGMCLGCCCSCCCLDGDAEVGGEAFVGAALFFQLW